MAEYILYGGKGGVGKTTCAAATGLRLAEEGAETLVVSTDPAHSLSDSFETELDSTPQEIREHLWAVEIDPDERKDAYRAMVASLMDDLRSAGLTLDRGAVDELFESGIPPGSDEIAALDHFIDYVDSGAWEYIVLDTAPTGHTLRLLDLPDVMSSLLETTLSVRGQVRRITDSARSMLFGPAYYMGTGGRTDGSDDFTALKERMERARDILRDPERSEFRIVLVPETMAVNESKRLIERLRSFGMPVGTLVVNKVVTDIDEGCERCRTRRETHRERIAEIRRTYPELEIQELPELDGEVHGFESLEVVAETIRI